MKAAIYIRVSSQAQSDEGTSLDSQEARCREYCAENGYEVVGVWSDVHTGADLHERRRMSALRQTMSEGATDVLVAYAVDRLTRDQIHLGVLLDECDRFGVRVETVTEPLELDPIGQVVLSVRAMAAAIEREKIRERTMRGKNARLAEGHLPTWTCSLYGYHNIVVRKKDQPDSREKSRRVIREDEAEVVRFIFRSVVEGRSLGSIVAELNERGVPSPGVTRMRYRSAKVPTWHPSSLHHMITNPAYKGVSVANRLTRTKFRNPDTKRVNAKREITRPESEWMILPEGLTPAIVDEDTWNLANERLRTNRGTYGRNERRPYLLRGRMVCAVCGGAMYSEQEGGKNQRRTYRCGQGKKGRCDAKTRVIADEIESWTWQQVLTVRDDRELVIDELRRRSAADTDLSLDAERSLLSRQAAEIEERQGRLLRRFAESETGVPWALIETEVGRMEGEKAAIRSKLSEVEAATADRDHRAIRVDTVADLIERLTTENLDRASFEQRARVIAELGFDVEVHPYLWTLNWSVPVGKGTGGRGTLLDLSRVPDPTPEQIEADRHLQAAESWRPVQAITSASISFGSA